MCTINVYDIMQSCCFFTLGEVCFVLLMHPEENPLHKDFK